MVLFRWPMLRLISLALCALLPGLSEKHFGERSHLSKNSLNHSLQASVSLKPCLLQVLCDLSNLQPTIVPQVYLLRVSA